MHEKNGSCVLQALGELNMLLESKIADRVGVGVLILLHKLDKIIWVKIGMGLILRWFHWFC